MSNNNLRTDAAYDRSQFERKLVPAKRYIACLLEVCRYLESTPPKDEHIAYIKHLVFSLDEALGEIEQPND